MEQGKLVPASEIVGNLVSEQLQKVHKELDEARKAIAELLEHAGSESYCTGCGAKIFWVRHVKGNKPASYLANGLHHWVPCRRPNNFKRKDTNATTTD
jgi:hypothetical protein